MCLETQCGCEFPPAVGRAACWHGSACRILPLRRTVLCILLFSPWPLHSRNLTGDLCQCGTLAVLLELGVEVRIQMDQFVGFTLIHEGFAHSLLQCTECTPKGRCMDLYLGLKGRQTADLSCETSAACVAPLWGLDKECKGVNVTHAKTTCKCIKRSLVMS